MTPAQRLSLTTDQLQEIRRALADKITEGLSSDGEEIRALPSYFGAPDRTHSGRALVIDTGGTNMRAAVVEVDKGRAAVVSGPIKRTLPMREGSTITADEFFAAQAALAKELAPPAGLPVGYCFSYPSANSPDRDSRLLRWTKGIDIPGVEGTLVGSRLHAALEAAGVAPGPVRVLNDTVASMLGGALVHDDVASERCIGLIVGTGNNMAGFFGRDESSKVPEDFSGKMAINLESGNFNPPHLTEFDEAVDRASDNPGFQRFEKAVSGFYLPFVFAQAMPKLSGFDPHGGTGQLVEFRDSEEQRDAEAKAVASALLRRSADLVAASLAGVIDHYAEGPESVGILAEGTFFWGDPQYASAVKETLGKLLGPSKRATVLETSEANLIGSAAAALEP